MYVSSGLDVYWGCNVVLKFGSHAKSFPLQYSFCLVCQEPLSSCPRHLHLSSSPSLIIFHLGSISEFGRSASYAESRARGQTAREGVEKVQVEGQGKRQGTSEEEDNGMGHFSTAPILPS
jgi:hypothetical protein